MTQPEALRLADELERDKWHVPAVVMQVAADELRRLHEAHDWQYKMAGERLRRIENLEAQRDALLEALKFVIRGVPDTWEGVQKARAAIKAMEEGK